ncbi:MAG: hypothetical protein Q9N62_10485 [Ghiorsea sp.]|nr:hypothetical protein [Ghiorsea sp.]
MDTTIIVAIIAIAGSFIVAVITYALNVSKELEAELRKEKLTYYKDFVESLSGVLEGEDTTEGHQLHSKAANNLLLFAPQNVLTAVEEYKILIATTTKRDEVFMTEHNHLLSNLMYQIRKDIEIDPEDNPDTFCINLWASSNLNYK